MRILSAAAIVLMVAACSRTSTAPHATTAPAVQPAPAATVALPTAATIPSSKSARKSVAAAKGKAASSAGSKSANPYDDDSRWVDVDAETLEPQAGEDDQAMLDFRAEQARRDRELLERDAEEAATREPYEDRAMDDLAPPVYDEPPMDDGDPPEDDYLPEDRYPPDDGYPPPGRDYPPEDEFER